MLTLPHIITPV